MRVPGRSGRADSFSAAEWGVSVVNADGGVLTVDDVWTGRGSDSVLALVSAGKCSLSLAAE